MRTVDKLNILTKNQQAVYDYLKAANGKFVAPTEIGNKVGGGDRHSAWASSICKRLVEVGVAKRNERGWYAV